MWSYTGALHQNNYPPSHPENPHKLTKTPCRPTACLPHPQGYNLTTKLSQPHILAESMDELLSIRQTFHVHVEDDTTHSQIYHKNEHISCNFLPFGVPTHLAIMAKSGQHGSHRDVTAPEQRDRGCHQPPASTVPRQNTRVLLQLFLLNISSVDLTVPWS